MIVIIRITRLITMRSKPDYVEFVLVVVANVVVVVLIVVAIHNDAEKNTIINDDEKFQQISVKKANSQYLAYGCSNQFGS